MLEGLIIFAFVSFCFGTELVYPEFKDSIAVNDDNIQSYIEKGDLFLLFHVPAMGACKEFISIWNEVARIHKEKGSKFTVAHINLQPTNAHVTKVRFKPGEYPSFVFIKDGTVYWGLESGLRSNRKPECLPYYVSFPETGYLEDKVRKQPLPAVPHVPQWFTTHDFIGLDGKKYPGAL